jgi:hypothetical protein
MNPTPMVSLVSLATVVSERGDSGAL